MTMNISNFFTRTTKRRKRTRLTTFSLNLNQTDSFTTKFSRIGGPLVTLVTNNQSLLTNLTRSIDEDGSGADIIPASFFHQYKIALIFGLSFLGLLFLLSILFLLFIYCYRHKGNNRKRLINNKHIDLGQFQDFLADQNNNSTNNTLLLTKPVVDNDEDVDGTHEHTQLIKPSDVENSSGTLSLGQQRKINKMNNRDDNTSIDTLRGSLTSSSTAANAAIASSPSSSNNNDLSRSKFNANVLHSPTKTSEHEHDAEKDDDLSALDLRSIYIQNKPHMKSNGSTNIKRTSDSAIASTIRKQTETAEDEERRLLHGSKPNIYEDEIRKRELNQQHTTSQMSINSLTSEKSCY
ncbi:unnamed protein product [Didymodactylos carnosus]|uniref:Uncharacterized protein n=1 Tax=Didymodactylos carnosus TaxID=1234261 RepID=A0A814DMC3_9BILA|nr:unnamed protein product [Didymodactylos carnosus]CAF0956455.1 unnamed protein product [Didymodactylos carnosus]CAF3725473.1 unnamed protein product [Didymodactylos carnosus]CAF3731429.1 unnamed protein product [Didymodactylos carnosus]